MKIFVRLDVSKMDVVPGIDALDEARRLIDRAIDRHREDRTITGMRLEYLGAEGQKAVVGKIVFDYGNDP